MTNKKMKYFLYLVLLHSACIFFIISRFVFPEWGRWLVDTQFLHSPFSVYLAMVIVIFPLFSVIPYYFQYDFPAVPVRKKWILAALLVGNTLLILAYTAVVSNIMSR